MLNKTDLAFLVNFALQEHCGITAELKVDCHGDFFNQNCGGVLYSLICVVKELNVFTSNQYLYVGS